MNYDIVNLFLGESINYIIMEGLTEESKKALEDLELLENDFTITLENVRSLDAKGSLAILKVLLGKLEFKSRDTKEYKDIVDAINDLLSGKNDKDNKPSKDIEEIKHGRSKA